MPEPEEVNEMLVIPPLAGASTQELIEELFSRCVGCVVIREVEVKAGAKTVGGVTNVFVSWHGGVMRALGMLNRAEKIVR